MINGRNMAFYNKQEEEVSPEVEEGKSYTKGELNAISDAILREHSRTELCRECDGEGRETGNIIQKEQRKDGKLLVNENGQPLVLEFKEYKCDDAGHTWYEGEGRVRGIGGDDPILFEEHFQSRRRREIYTSLGTPDPSIVQGQYNRTHPQGRKVNSEEQRKRNGASYYR
jgi:hypothetical protein